MHPDLRIEGTKILKLGRCLRHDEIMSGGAVATRLQIVVPHTVPFQFVSLTVQQVAVLLLVNVIPYFV